VSQIHAQHVISDHDVEFDDAADVIVVGTGAAGYSAAIAAVKHGSSVIQLEKAGRVGGTTRKAQGWIWAPNNHFMQAAGIPDPLDDFLKLVARLARPNHYNPHGKYFGLSQWQYEQSMAFYKNAPKALETLNEWGAIRLQHGAGVPEYHCDLPENAVESGRAMFPSVMGEADETIGTGEDLIGQLDKKARELGIDIRLHHAVQRVYLDSDGRVTGVQAQSNSSVSYRARKAVIFASGGFTHNVEMRNNFLSGPIFGGCAAQTNTGDFIAIANDLSTELTNMNYPLMAPMVLDYAIANKADITGTWRMGGDAMIMVNKYGHRVADEKALYHELAQVFHTWDPSKMEYPNLVLIAIWDADAQEHFSNQLIPGYDYTFGNPMLIGKPEQPHLLEADTIGDLVERIDKHLKEFSAYTGGTSIAEDFMQELTQSIERFNQFAKAGLDQDFHRGERPMTVFFNGLPRPGNTANPTMFPISGTGPYYATVMAPSAIDTNGGPKTDQHSRVLRRDGSVVPGLYAAGNCAGSPFGQAYLGAGATLGPYLTNGYIAGTSAATSS
jgi:3-oxosteroid 1-dehydrogenase